MTSPLPRITPEFSKAIKGLNSGQKQAVEALVGPVMVVAGPGTGKTHVLTLRIANILQKTDTPPDGILALTFTEAGASNMRKRLGKMIGAAAYRVRIHTFHSYCHDVIRRFPDDFPRIIGSEALSQVEKVEIIEHILASGAWKILKPFTSPLHYLDDIRATISELKRENFSPAAFKTFVQKEQKVFEATDDLYHESGAHKAETSGKARSSPDALQNKAFRGEMKGKYHTKAKQYERSLELAEIFALYEKELRERKRFDFEDMIVEVVQALEKNEDLRLRLQEESLYVLADEHQDANTSQNRLLELLSDGDSPNLFVVGDDKQAIFRFQGASLENFHYFKSVFPSAQRVTLSESYRSGQKILDTAHALITGDGREHVPLVERGAVGVHSIEVCAVDSSDAEKVFIAQQVKKLTADGVEPHEIAVIYRTNKEGAEYGYALEEVGFTVSIESDQNALEDPIIRRLLSVVRLVASPENNEHVLMGLHAWFTPLPPVDIYRIASFAARREITLSEVISDDVKLKEARVKKPKIFKELWGLIQKWRDRDMSVPMQVSRIIEESGFVSYALASAQSVEILDKAGALVRDVETLAIPHPDYSLSDLVTHLAILDERRIPINKGTQKTIREGAVRLMTAHRAKGLEFDHVFVVNVVDGVWGGRREISLFALPPGSAKGTDEDERRLLYVALTRGKRGVTVTYPRSHNGKEKLRSRLLEDVDPVLLSERSVEVPKRLGVKKTRTRTSKPTLEFVRQRFVEQGLSVTALNNYLSCPWEYFYQNLVRIPKAQNSTLLFGTACHTALRLFFNERNKNQKVSVKDLIAHLKDTIKRLPLTSRERADMLERGTEFFTGWYKEWNDTWPKESLQEYKIEVACPVEVEGLREIRLRGDLDKIEFSSDGVTVVDYKTGRPRSRNELEGGTKNATGDYLRQLVFYKLLLGLDGKYTMKRGVIDFLQPEREKYTREQFNVLPEQVKELEVEIARVAGEVWNLSFWNTRCGEEDCQFCKLREMLQDL
ncbi:ATP-dependent helicase [bacterium]|nr:ATP-dependent helicase [bacterium]